MSLKVVDGQRDLMRELAVVVLIRGGLLAA
jgi:hypothetical protein